LNCKNSQYVPTEKQFMKYREKETTYDITAMKTQTTVAVLLLAGLLVLAIITVPVVYTKKHKADRTESFTGGPMSAQDPDPKRLISDDPAGSPSSEGAIKGYAQGQKDYAKGTDQGFNAQPEGGHTSKYKNGFSEGYNLGHEDPQLKKNGQLSPDYLSKIK
jgi:hypothetical protein